VGLETLRSNGKILTDIAQRKSTDVNAASAGDIFSKHVTESAQNLISELRVRGRERAHYHHSQAAAVGGKKARNITKTKPAPRKIIMPSFPSLLQSLFIIRYVSRDGDSVV